MKPISHRGNQKGRSLCFENQPIYIHHALDKGFSVEIDVWRVDGNWFLGHDKPQYPTTFSFLNNQKFYLHCKNLAALTYLSGVQAKCDFFAHNNDSWVLTAKGQIWTFPGEETGPNSIIVDFSENARYNHSNVYGICADYL